MTTRARVVGLVAAALALSAVAATDALAAPVPSSLVNTIETWRWSPPSPDPSGLAYDSNTNRLLVSDSEVDEMSIYAGANYYEATLGGKLLRTTNTLAFSHEPTGLAVDSGNRLFFTDDDWHRVFQVALGANGSFDATDSSTWFSTKPYGIVDPEGTAYDKVGERLFVADGKGSEIWQILPVDGIFGNGDDQVQHFDTTALGVADPEAVEFNPDTGTLFTIGSPGRKIVEVTTSGAVVSEIDTSYLPLVHPAEMIYAPRSTDPTKNSFYIADRKVDNDHHPTENDGVIYEVAPGSSGGGPPPPGDVRVAASSDAAEAAPLPALAPTIPRRVLIGCANKRGTAYKLVYRPRRCTRFSPSGGFGPRAVNLAGLKWSSWNGSVARGRGIERGFHLPYSKIRVRVWAYRVRVACGRRVYTRLKARSRYGTTVARMAGCPGPV